MGRWIPGFPPVYPKGMTLEELERIIKGASLSPSESEGLIRVIEEYQRLRAVRGVEFLELLNRYSEEELRAFLEALKKQQSGEPLDIWEHLGVSGGSQEGG